MAFMSRSCSYQKVGFSCKRMRKKWERNEKEMRKKEHKFIIKNEKEKANKTWQQQVQNQMNSKNETMKSKSLRTRDRMIWILNYY